MGRFYFGTHNRTYAKWFRYIHLSTLSRFVSFWELSLLMTLLVAVAGYLSIHSG